jgi:hypothetical protein
MKLDDAGVMAFPRKLVEHALLGLYDPVNEHLVKLSAFDFPPQAREHFRCELRGWLKKISRLRMKPNNRTGSVKFYFDHFFDYPFGGAELENMQSIIDQISDEYGVRPTKTPDEMVEWLRTFHMKLAERLHNREEVLDLIPE